MLLKNVCHTEQLSPWLLISGELGLWGFVGRVFLLFYFQIILQLLYLTSWENTQFTECTEFCAAILGMAAKVVILHNFSVYMNSQSSLSDISNLLNDFRPWNLKAEVAWRIIPRKKGLSYFRSCQTIWCSIDQEAVSRFLVNLSLNWHLNNCGGKLWYQKLAKEYLRWQEMVQEKLLLVVSMSDLWLCFTWLQSVELSNHSCGLAEHVTAVGWLCYDLLFFVTALQSASP